MPKPRPIFYSALMLTGVNLLLRLVSTAFGVYISGRIGPAGVGLLQLVLSVGMLAMTAGMAGVRTAAMYLSAEELGRKQPGNISWVLSGCFFYSILCSGAVALALSFFAPWIAGHWIGDPRTLGALRLFAAFLPITCLCGVMTGYFTAANRIATLAFVEVAEQFCSMAVTLTALSLWAGTDPAKACQAVVLGSSMGAVLTLAALGILRLRERPPIGPRIPVGRRLLGTAGPLALGDVTKSSINTIENLMVPKRLALYTGIADPLAAFGTVCGMVFPVLMFPAAILFGLAELLIPELARCNAAGSHKRIQYLSGRSLRVAILYGCVFSALLFLLSDPLCLALYDSEDAGKFLRLFAPLIPMLYCDAIVDAMVKGLGQQAACVRYNILTSFLDVVFLYWLLPRYGMEGYFTSFFITHLINFLLSLGRLRKITPITIPAKVPILTALSAAASVWAASYLPHPVSQAMGCLAILSCLLLLLGVVNREDGRWLFGLLRKNDL